MKIFSFFIFSMLVVQSNAQLTFFVRPSINLKSDLSSSGLTDYSDYVMDVSPYYKYDNILFHSLFHGLDLSLSFGFKTNSKKYILEFGLSGDETQSGYKLNYFITTPNYYSTNDVYFGSNTGYIYGRAFPRLFIQNSIRLKEFKNSSNLYFIAGFGYGYKKNDVSHIPLGEIEEIVKVDENVYLKRESALYVTSLKNLFIHFGISSEVHFKNKYLFDAAFFYNQGLNSMSVVSTHLTVYSDTSSKEMLYTSVSKGSGLYLQFSRQLQVYPWKKKNKEGV